MLNGTRPFFTRLMTPVGEALARTPITPNMVTVTGTVGLSASVLWGYPTGHLFWGTLVATFFVFTDMLDGVLARIKGTTGKFGAFLDSTMDRIADAAVFSGLAIWFVRGGHNQLLPACRSSAWWRGRWCRTSRPAPRAWARPRTWGSRNGPSGWCSRSSSWACPDSGCRTSCRSACGCSPRPA